MQQGSRIPIPRPAPQLLTPLHKGSRERGSLSAYPDMASVRFVVDERGEAVGPFRAHLFAECRARLVSSKSSSKPAAPSISSAGSDGGPPYFCAITHKSQLRRSHARKQCAISVQQCPLLSPGQSPRSPHSLSPTAPAGRHCRP